MVNACAQVPPAYLIVYQGMQGMCVCARVYLIVYADPNRLNWSEKRKKTEISEAKEFLNKQMGLGYYLLPVPRHPPV